MNRKRIIVTSLLITLISLLGKVIGFVRETLLADFFGTSHVVDAYLMSIYIPSILFGWLPAIGAGYVPKYFEVEKEKRDRFTSNVLCWTILFALVSIVIALIFNDQIVRLVAPGYLEERYKLTVFFSRITIWTVLLITPIQILISYLNCKERFLQSSVSGLFLSLIQSIGIVLGAKNNLVMLPLGVLAAYLMQFIFLYVSCHNCKLEFKWLTKWDDDIKSLLRLIIPIFISNSLVDINSFVDQFLASTLETGSVSGLNYAFNLKSFFYLIFTTAITTIMYPKISSMIAEGREKEASGYIENTMIIIIVIFLPLTVGALTLSEPLIKCVYMRGAFNNQSLAHTVGPFVMYTIALPFLAIRDIFIKVLYACKNSKANLIGGGIAITINILLSVILVKRMGNSGLAMATSLSCIFSFPFYIFAVFREKIRIHIKNILKWLFASAVSTGIMWIVVKEFKENYLQELSKMDIEYYIKLVILIVAGGITYFSFMVILNFPEIVRGLKHVIKKRSKV